MKIEIRRAELTERKVVSNLMELYQHDFSELDGTDMDENGQYGYYDLDYFWVNPTWSAYVIKVDDKWAGFALTNDEVQTAGNTRAIVEFFVVRKYRGKGLGRKAAQAIMTMFPAKWEIRIIEENGAALNFWRTLINSAWPDSHELTISDNEHWNGPVFSVDTRISNTVERSPT